VISSREPRAQSPATLRNWLGGLLSLLLALGLLVLPGSAGSSEALGLPGRNPRQSMGPDAFMATSSAVPATLQEVAPPLAVQQLQEALAEREPRVEILAPADEALLPAGPWSLRLRVHDWPLVDGGQLGLGPHLVVQLDDDEPRPLTSTELTMPALAPGSHRLTVFAARPWGEAAKNPGAWQQIRLHRAAANPLALPEPGLAQLIAVSPTTSAATEPLLVDWLLLDAPLQNLRSDDARWRLRLTINGDGFVIDRQTPLWLKGWRPGRNAIKFELLDGLGEPLTPPYNSLVREVELSSATPAARWQQGRLSAGELAILLGEAAPVIAVTAAEPAISPELAVASEPKGPGQAGELPTSAPEPWANTPATRAEASTQATAAQGPWPRAVPGPETVTGAAPGDSAPSEARPEPTSLPRAAAADPGNSADQPEPLHNRDHPAEAKPASSQARPESSNGSTHPDPATEPEPPERVERSEPLARLEASEGPGASGNSGVGASPLPSGSARVESHPPGSTQLADSTGVPATPARPRPQTTAPAKTPKPPLANKPAASTANPAAAARSGPSTGTTAAAYRDPEAASLSASQSGSEPRTAQPVAGQAVEPEPTPEPVAFPEPPSLVEAIPATSQRLTPSSAIGGPARDQVNADGTMIKPPGRGPLAALRERLLP